MQVILVSNNEIALNETVLPARRVEGNSLDVMMQARDLVHQGWNLLSHPLGASIKMLHSPVVSILLERGAGQTDPVSLELVESDIYKVRTVLGQRDFDYRNRDAYSLVDWNRMQSALNELNLYGKDEDIATRT